MQKHCTILALFFLSFYILKAENVPHNGLPVNDDLKIPLPILKEIALNTSKQLAASDFVKEIEKTIEKEEDISFESYAFPESDGTLKEMVNPDFFEMNTENDDLTDVLVAVGSADLSGKVAKAREVIDQAIAIGNFISTLTGDDLVSLPLAINQEIGNLTAHIVFNSITLTATGTKLEVFAGMTIPQKGVDEQGRAKDLTLMFSADDIEISSTGGIQGVGTLMLLEDVAFQLGGSKKKTAIVLRHGTKTGEGEDAEYDGTFVTLGCSGLLEFGLSAKIYFSRDWILPADEFGEPIENGDRVTAEFEIKVQDWNNMLIEELTISRFVAADFKEVSLYVGNANLDLSDYRNPSTLPTSYEPNLPPVKELWRGVYIQTIEVTLPKPFKRKCDGFGDNFELDESNLLAENEILDLDDSSFQNVHFYSEVKKGGPNAEGYIPTYVEEEVNTTVSAQCRIKLAANDLIIDKDGVTGHFSITGGAPLLGGGQMNKKWSWSLDYLAIDLVRSEFKGFAFGGVISAPITDDSTPLGYTAGIDFDLEEPVYDFNVTLGDDLEFPLFNAAKVTLYGGSNLDVNYDSNTEEFKPILTLYGNLAIGKPEDYNDSPQGSKAKLPSVEFMGLVVQTEPAYLGIEEGGYISLSSGEGNIMNFPVSIDNIGLVSVSADGEITGEATITSGATGEASKIGLAFDIKLNLMNPTDGGMSATGNFLIVGQLTSDINGSHRWKFDDFKFGGAEVIIDLPKVKGCGILNIFDEDPNYGSGFSANLNAVIMGPQDAAPPCPGAVSNPEGAFVLQMAAVFGSVDGYRYFLLDGYVGGDAINIPIPPTPLIMNGFGGGVFHHMRPTGFADAGQSTAGVATSTSGVIYSPDPGTKLGLKFAVGLTSTAGTLEGKLTCIIRFGAGLSLQNITFWGVADFVNPVAISVPNSGFLDRVAKFADSEEDMQKDDLEKAQALPEDKISMKVGLSLDFEDGFTLHGYAEVFLRAAQSTIVGTGTMDLLVAPSENEWHLYVGGYRDGSVEVPTFWGDDGSVVSLYPLNVGIEYAGVDVSADAYFLLGNTIPGPPAIHPAAAAYFGGDTEEPDDNRDILYCEGRTPANGSGIAFGASLFFEFKKTIKKWGVKVLQADVKGGLGFDISLLKYGAGTACNNANIEPGPHGVNYFRMTGNMWAFVSATGKVFVVPLPEIGVGVMMKADIPNPSYFEATVLIKFIKKFKFNLDIGEECGHPCSTAEN